jgi:hypothetical protein
MRNARPRVRIEQDGGREWRGTYGDVDTTIVEEEGGVGEGEIVDLLPGEGSDVSGGHWIPC